MVSRSSRGRGARRATYLLGWSGGVWRDVTRSPNARWGEVGHIFISPHCVGGIYRCDRRFSAVPAANGRPRGWILRVKRRIPGHWWVGRVVGDGVCRLIWCMEI